MSLRDKTFSNIDNYNFDIKEAQGSFSEKKSKRKHPLSLKQRFSQKKAKGFKFNEFWFAGNDSNSSNENMMSISESSAATKWTLQSPLLEDDSKLRKINRTNYFGKKTDLIVCRVDYQDRSDNIIDLSFDGKEGSLLSELGVSETRNRQVEVLNTFEAEDEFINYQIDDVLLCSDESADSLFSQNMTSYESPKVQIDEGKYKTEMCKNWIASGFCRYGRKCRFAHGNHELSEKKIVTIISLSVGSCKLQDKTL